jgi:WD40 repeat protein
LKIKKNINFEYLGLCLSSTVPGFLITSSFDETVKIWDIENGNVTFVAERKFQTVNFQYVI